MLEITVKKRPEINTWLDEKRIRPNMKEAIEKTLITLESKTFEVGSGHAVEDLELELKGIEIEQDAELPSWKYAVISLRLPAGLRRDVRALMREKGERKIAEAVYSQLSPREATTILLDFEDV